MNQGSSGKHRRIWTHGPSRVDGFMYFSFMVVVDCFLPFALMVVVVGVLPFAFTIVVVVDK